MATETKRKGKPNTQKQEKVWSDHLFDVKGSLIPEITPRVLSCVIWSVAVVAFDHTVCPLGVPPTVHTLVGIALGLLLVFRTNSSYDRFWGGARVVGAPGQHVAKPGPGRGLKLIPRLLEEVIRWTGGFPYAVRNVLRGTEGLGPIAADLPKRDINWILQAEHTPLAIARRITSRLVRWRQGADIRHHAGRPSTRTCNSWWTTWEAVSGFKSTPLPYSYMVHLRA